MNRNVQVVLFLLLAGSTLLSAQEEERGLKIVGEPTEPPVAAQPELDRTPVLPSDPLGGDAGNLATVGAVFVNEIRLRGNTVFTEAELAGFLAPYEGHEILIEELHQLRQTLSREYFERGFVNSGVVIPDQRIDGGEIELQEIRGSLTRINVSGNKHLTRKHVVSRLNGNSAATLQINELQQALQLFQRDPLVRRVNAQLVPGAIPGQSELDVSLVENSPYQLVVGTDNYRSPSIGAEELTLSFTHFSLTGHRDALLADFSVSEGLTNGGLSYSYPLDAQGTAIQAYFRLGDSDIVEEPFDQLDIVTATDTWGISTSHPFRASVKSTVLGSYGFEVKHAESTLLDIPFSFSAGDQNGESNTSVVWVGVAWTAGFGPNVLALRGSVRQGIDALDATINESGPDGEFTTFLAQLRYARNMSWWRSQLIVRGTAQLAADPLLAIEKMPVGGALSVRGYRENTFVRDNGVVASAELQIPLPRPANLRLAAFFDYGRSWDEGKGPNSRAEEISSAGLGLLWRPLTGFGVDLYWGHPFDDVNDLDDDLQDDGLHFRIAYQIPLGKR